MDTGKREGGRAWVNLLSELGKQIVRQEEGMKAGKESDSL